MKQKENYCHEMENIPERKPIQTFVFLDIESTGLLAMEKPKMTEICLTAVHREELLNVSKNSRSIGSAIEAKRAAFLPRVADSINLCLNPGKPVEPAAYEISGLDNINLHGSRKRPFGDMEAMMLMLFLNRQEGPICMVAHNGMKFDFPLLKAELHRINFNFPYCDIRCGDTLQAFRDLDATTVKASGHLTNQRSRPTKRFRPGQISPSANNGSLSARLEQRVRASRVARSLFTIPVTDGNVAERIFSEPARQYGDGGKACDSNGDHLLAELPQKTQRFEPTVRSKFFAPGLGVSDVFKSPSPTSREIPMGILTPRRLATLTRQATPSPGKSFIARHQPRSQCSYKLSDVYKNTFGVLPDQSHQASADVNNLISIFTSQAALLIDYFENHSVSFGNVKPFYQSLKTIDLT